MNTQNIKTAASESSGRWGERQDGGTTGATDRPEKVFYSPSLFIGWHAVRVSGKWRTRADGRTLGELRQTWPDMVLVKLSEYQALSAARHCTPVKEIDEARFTDQLEVLPPEDWQYPGKGQGQSFKSSEYWSGDVTAIFAHVQGRFFEFRDRCTLSHQDIVARIQKEVFDREQK
ncbi:hypothetical protein [Erwinia aphidicola]|uniref:Uncharacterized protein n=1 Tax=Erwinia aphidicola TaxID=68334 RepID=A0ABU8DMA0_ERWAP